MKNIFVSPKIFPFCFVPYSNMNLYNSIYPLLSRLFSQPMESRSGIVGGQPATLGQFPYQLSWRFSSNANQFCGAQIIDAVSIFLSVFTMYGKWKDLFALLSSIY